MKIKHVFKNDPLGRQVMEGVQIRELKVDHILNSKDEFHQPGEVIPVLGGVRRSNSQKDKNDNSQGVRSQNMEPEEEGDNWRWRHHNQDHGEKGEYCC